MDEESGQVIDGTARARHWRRSQPKSTAGTDGPQDHSEAPKSIAASLLVPPMLDDELESPLSQEPASDNGGGSLPPTDGTGTAAGHRNVFLSPDAVVPAPLRRRSMQISTVALRLVHRASTARRRIPDIRLLWPQFSRSRARIAAVLGLAAGGALAAVLAVVLQPASSPPLASVGHAGSLAVFERLKERSLLAEGPFAAVSPKAKPRVSVSRTAARRSVRRVRHIRQSATRIASVPAASGATSVSHSTAGTSDASVVTASASRVTSTTAVSETAAQQLPAQQTQQQQHVHYQPPPQPAGPAGLGSQVGGDCNPKCS